MRGELRQDGGKFHMCVYDSHRNDVVGAFDDAGDELHVSGLRLKWPAQDNLSKKYEYHIIEEI